MNRHTFRTAFCGGRAAPLAAVETLEAQGWLARPDSSPVPVPTTPEDWAADPFHDRNWRFQLHSWRPLDAYIVADDITGEPGMLERAARVILSWRDAEAGSDDDALFWNDMGTGLRAAKLAYVLTRMSEDTLPSRATREAMIALGRRHLERLRHEDFFSLSNHGLFQVHGLTALVDAMPAAPEADRGKAFAERMFDRILASQFGEEGVHLEHSPGYHYFAILTLRKMMATHWYDGRPHVRQIVDRATAALPWFVFPDGRMSGMGDSDRNKLKVRPPSARKMDARLFREAGYAVVRNAWSVKPQWQSMLLVTASHHSHVHKHADDLSFEWYDKGRFWIVDTGKYSYSRKDWREFTDSAAAHNTVRLTDQRMDNGLGLTRPAGGGLTTAARDNAEWVVEGAIARPEIGARHSRSFRFDPRHSLTIVDRIELDDDREVTAWLHLAPDLIAEQTRHGWRFPGGRISYAVTGASLDLVRVRGQTKPEIQGWMAESYHRLAQNDALGARLTGRSIELVTTITLD